MAEGNEIVIKALLDLGLNKGEADKIQKILEKSIKPDIQFDLTAAKAASRKGGLLLSEQQTKLLQDISSGKLNPNDLTKGMRKSLDEALGRLQRQTKQGQDLVRELDRAALAVQRGGTGQGLEKGARATTATPTQFNEFEAAMAKLRREVTKLSQAFNTANSAANLPALERQSTKEGQRKAAAESSKSAAQQDRVQKAEAIRQARAEQAQARQERGAKIVARQGLQPDFSKLTDQQELKDVQSFLRDRERIAGSRADQMVKEFGPSSEQAKIATAEALRYSKALGQVAERLRQVRELEKAGTAAQPNLLQSQYKLAQFRKKYEDARIELEQKLQNIQAKNQRGTAAASAVSAKGVAGLSEQDLKQAKSVLQEQYSAMNAFRKQMIAQLGQEAKETRAANDALKEQARVIGQVNEQIQKVNKARKQEQAQAKATRKEMKELAKAEKESVATLSQKQKLPYQTVLGQRGYGVDMDIANRSQAARTIALERQRERLSEQRAKEQAEQEKRESALSKIRAKQSERIRQEADREADHRRKMSEQLAKANQAAAEQQARIEAAKARYIRALEDAAKMYPRGAAAVASPGTADRNDVSQGKSYANRVAAANRTYERAISAELGSQAVEAKRAASEVARYSASVGELNNRMRELGKASGAAGLGVGHIFQTFTRYAIGYGALYEALQGIGALVRNVVQLDTDLKAIQAVSLTTDRQMDSLANSIERVALSTKFSNQEIADSVRTLVQAGVAAEDLDSVIQATANFASATNSSLQVAADLITTTRAVFDQLDDNTLTNQLTKAVNISKLQAEDLQTILSLGAQVANSYKISSDQFLAAVTTLRNAGIKPSTVATGLRQAMLEVFSPDQKTMELLIKRYAALGENMSSEAIRSRFLAFQSEENPLTSAIGELRRLGFAGEARQDFARVFDVRAYNPLLALVQQYDKLIENEAKITFGAPAAEAAAIQMEALSAKLENLGGAITAYVANASGGLIEMIGKATDAATRGIEEMSRVRAERESGVSAGGEEPGGLAKAADFLVNDLYKYTKGYAIYKGGKNFYQQSESPEEQADMELSDRIDAARKAASATTKVFDSYRARMQEFEDAAAVFDVEAAKAGNAAGKSAEALYQAGEEIKKTEEHIADFFGNSLPETVSQVSELAEIYAELGSAQKQARFEDLKAKFPALQNASFSQFDSQLTSIANEFGRTRSFLKAVSDDTLQTVLRYNDIIAGARDKSDQQLSALEVQAREFNKQFETDANYRAALEGKGSEAERLEIITQANQRIAEGVREFFRERTKQEFDNLLSATFAADSKLALTSAGVEAGKLQVKTSLENLIAQIEGVDDIAAGRFKALRDAIYKTAKQLEQEGDSEAAEAVRELGTIPLERFGERKAEQRKAATLRQQNAEDSIAPAFSDPKFNTFITENKVGLSATDLRIVQTFSGDLSALSEAARDNTAEFKRMAEIHDIFATSEARRIDGELKLKDALESRATLEEQLSDVQRKIAEAESNNNFSALPALRKEQSRVKTEIISGQLSKETEALKADPSAKDADSRKEKIGRLTRDRNKVEEERLAADLADSKRRAQVERDARRRIIELVNDQLNEKLDAAIEIGDEAKIDEYVSKLDANNQELVRLTEAELKASGVKGDLLDQELKAKREELKALEDQVDYREKVYQKEKEVQDQRLEDLQITSSDNEPTREGAFRRKYGYTDKEASREDDLKEISVRQQNAAEMETTRINLEAIREEQLKLQAEGSELFDETKLAQANAQLRELKFNIAENETALADLRLETETLGDTELPFFSMERWRAGWEGAKSMFDDTLSHIKYGMQESQYTVDRIAQNTAGLAVNAFESMGDAIANEFMDTQAEGESFSDEMKRILSDMGDELLRQAIKAVTNAMIQQFISMLVTAFIGGGVGATPNGPAAVSVGAPAYTSSAGTGPGFNGMTPMLATGGIIGMATGGMVKGPGTGTSDDVPGYIVGKDGKKKPVMLSNGEAVLTAEATKNLGADFIAAANSGSLFRMAEGGVVGQDSGGAEKETAADRTEKASLAGAAQVADSIKSNPINLTVNNNFDKEAVVGGALRTVGVRKELQNYVREEKSTINTILRN